MAKIQRKAQKIFAGNANASEIAVFGSMKTGTPVYSSDIETLQSTAYGLGWDDALLADKAPYLEEMNGVQYGLSSQIAYLLQEGISEYDSNTTYYKNSVVKDPNESNEVALYRSLTNDNTGNPLTDTVNWGRMYITTTGYIGQPQFTLNFSATLPANCIWLEGAEVSRTTYSNLFSIYGTTYGAGDGSTTFNLPDFRGRAIWGADTAGYLSAGLPNIWGNAGGGDNEGIWDNGWSNGALLVGKENRKFVSHGSGSGSNATYIDFNASRYNSIYGNSTTVQPPSIKVRIYTRYQ